MKVFCSWGRGWVRGSHFIIFFHELFSLLSPSLCVPTMTNALVLMEYSHHNVSLSLPPSSSLSLSLNLLNNHSDRKRNRKKIILTMCSHYCQDAIQSASTWGQDRDPGVLAVYWLGVKDDLCQEIVTIQPKI